MDYWHKIHPDTFGHWSIQYRCRGEDCPTSLYTGDKECVFFGGVQVSPRIIAAASLLPPKQSAEYYNAKQRRWEKVKLLTLPSSWYDGQRDVLSQMVDVTSAPELTMQQVQDACEDAIRREEWELAREFLKYYYTETAKGEASMLEPIQTD